MVIYRYLPKKFWPEDWERLSVEEFLELYGKADCARELGIEDLASGVMKGLGAVFGAE